MPAIVIKFLVILFDVLPNNILSRLFGKWASIEFPSFLQTIFNKGFCFFCKIDLRDCGRKASDFKTVNLLFTRKVDMTIRPIEDGFPSPCDGKLLQFADSYRGQAVQAKTLSYDLNILCDTKSTNFGWYSTCLLYTSPSPRDATLSRMPSSA